jgi:hypothetical protein
MRNTLRFAPTSFLLMAAVLPARADYDLTWYTIAAGGGFSSSASFELSGTAGQPAAGLMSSASYAVAGGFWANATSGPGVLVGDLNCDGTVGFGDINPFVLFLSNYSADINPFVALLTGGQ